MEEGGQQKRSKQKLVMIVPFLLDSVSFNHYYVAKLDARSRIFSFLFLQD